MTPQDAPAGPVLGEADPLSTPCLQPMCSAKVGQPCHTDSYMPQQRKPHPVRVEVAALVAAAREGERRVRELHQPGDAQGLPEGCAEVECEHDESGSECPLVTVRICGHCDGIRESAAPSGPLIDWPCPTIKALDGVS